MGSELLPFVGIAALLIVSPGPDMALVTSHALRGGRRAGILTALGIVTGLFVHAGAAVAGVSALLLGSAVAFTAVKLAGAAYLVYLGIHTLWESRRPTPCASTEAALAPRRPGSPFRQGLLSNAFNPKVAAFYLSFLPQFIRPDDVVWLRSLLLAGLFQAMALTWLVGYAALAGSLRGVLDRPGTRRVFERISGAVLVGMGLRLAVERR